MLHYFAIGVAGLLAGLGFYTQGLAKGWENPWWGVATCLVFGVGVTVPMTWAAKFSGVGVANLLYSCVVLILLMLVSSVLLKESVPTYKIGFMALAIVAIVGLSWPTTPSGVPGA